MKSASASDQFSLKQRIGYQLTGLIRAYVVLTGIFVVVATLTISYYYKMTSLIHLHALIKARVSAQGGNMLQQMQALGASSVLWTGISDTVDRSIYLEPLLKQFNNLGGHQLFLLDYRGRVLIAPDKALASQLLETAPVVQAVRDSRSAYGMAASVMAGKELFIYVRPIFSPQVELPVGFIVGSMSPQDMLKDMVLDNSVKVRLNIGGSPPVSSMLDIILLDRDESTIIRRGNEHVPMHVHLSQKQWDTLFFVVIFLALIALIGRWIIFRVTAWSVRFAVNTTERLDLLVHTCQEILMGRAVAPQHKVYDDEISSVFQALAKMLGQQKAITDELRTTSLVFMTAAEAILVTDEEGKIVDVNPALTRMTGYSRLALLGQLAGTLYRALGADEQPLDITQTLNAEGTWQGETFFLHKNGKQIPTTTSISTIFDDNEKKIGRVAVISDVSLLKEAQQKLRFLAYHDALTELPNLRMLASRVDNLFGESRLNKQPAALLFIDMDRLKTLNDNYGHEIGDVVIKAVAQHLSARLPPGHLLCRRSGDEFIALIEISDDMSRDVVQCNYLGDLNNIVVSTDAGLVAVSVSAGAARYPLDADNFNDLMICADIALNEAKQGGRGSIAWYDSEMSEKLYRQKLIQSKLTKALAAKLLVVHYQPEVDLRDGRVVGFEALLRWTDPELGVIHPSEFIRISEESHLAELVAIYVFNQIAKDKKSIQRRFPNAIIAFNVAPQAFRDDHLVNVMTAQHDQDDGSLSGLEMEITESDIASGENSLLTQLQTLACIGVPVVIDDFGMGYSSLNRLSSFPISRLKIDGTFVASMQEVQQARIVEVIVNLAKVLNLGVTAEGVENNDQRLALIKLGCVRAQGWLYARAMPLSDVMRLPDVLQALVWSEDPAGTAAFQR